MAWRAAGGLCFGLTMLSAACGERDPWFDLERAWLPPAALERDVAFVDRAHQEVLLLDVGATDPAPALRAIALPSPPLLRERRRSAAAPSDQLLVLCAGVAETRDRDRQSPSLEVITGQDSASASYGLRNTFDTLRQSDDGKYAFLFLRDPEHVPSLLANPNEAAIVDLDAAPGPNNPRFRSLIALGGVPTDVVFSPEPFDLGGVSRRIAVLLAEGYVSIVDLAHPDRPEKMVPLTVPDADRIVRPVQVLFEADARRIYVRADGSDAISVLDLTADAEGDEGAFVVSVTQVSAGRRPTDMLLFEATGGGSRLLVVASGSREIAVIEPRSGRVVPVHVDAAIDRAFKFRVAAPGTAAEAERVLLYATGSDARTITFVDLANLEERRRLNLDTYVTPAAIQRMERLDARGVAALIHDGSTSGPRLSLVDLAQRTISPILSRASLSQAMLDAETDRLWIAPRHAEALGFMDLAGLHTGEVGLDAPIDHFLAMAETTGRVVVVHPGAEGYVTLLDAREPSRRTAKVLRNFFYAGLLDRGER